MPGESIGISNQKPFHPVLTASNFIKRKHPAYTVQHRTDHLDRRQCRSQRTRISSADTKWLDYLIPFAVNVAQRLPERMCGHSEWGPLSYRFESTAPSYPASVFYAEVVLRKRFAASDACCRESEASPTFCKQLYRVYTNLRPRRTFSDGYACLPRARTANLL